MSEQVVMRILRETNGYSQEYVAGKLNINQNTYSKLETGQSKLTVERMKQLAELYDVPADLFLETKASILNFNTGEYSRSVVLPTTYRELKASPDKLYERIIAEKEKQIGFLTKELQETKQERDELRRTLINHNTKA